MQSRPGRLCAALLSLALLAAWPAGAAANQCAGGGRQRPDEGGIGGTGLRPPRPDEGGIGGTGISQNDSGIIGTITGFASICVGGTEIHYGAHTPVEIDGVPASASQLAVGQVVEVLAAGAGDEVSARAIRLRHIVSGPVTALDAAHDRIEVIGQAVQLGPGTRTADDSAAGAAAFSPGAFVQVSGMRRADGVIAASRIAEARERAEVFLSGPVGEANANELIVAGTAVRFGESRVAAPEVGSEVRVSGRWDGRAVVASAAEVMAPIPFDGRVSHLDIEGFARDSGSGWLRLGSFRVEIPSDVASPPRDARVRIRAVVRDRNVVAERISVVDALPPLPAAPAPDQGGRGHGPQHDGEGPPPDRRPDQRAPDAHLPHASAPPAGSGADQPARPAPQSRPALPPPQPERPERPPRPVRPERPPVPELPERPQVLERPQLPERPPRPERPEIPRRP